MSYIGNDDDDEQIFLSERILSGQDVRFSREFSGGRLGGTIAEGEFGKRLHEAYLKGRTPEERAVDRLGLAAVDGINGIKIDDFVTNSVKELAYFIPNLAYKSSLGLLLGYMARNHLKDSDEDRKKLQSIFDIAEKIKEPRYKVTPVDIVRYARLFNIVVLPKKRNILATIDE